MDREESQQRETAPAERSADGGPVHADGPKRPIQTLMESKEELRAFLDHAADGILVADVANRRFHDCNPSICRMLGYDRSELLEMGVEDIHPPEDMPRVMEQFGRQVRGEITLTRDMPVRRRDGSVLYADVNAFVLTLDGETYLAGIFRDVTTRKNAIDALRQSEQKYRMLTESTNDVIYSSDVAGRLTYLSPQVSRYGFTAEEIVGSSFLDVIHPEDRDRVSRDYERTLATGQEFPTEFRVTAGDGSIRWLEERGKVQRDRDGKIAGVFGVLRDITERKQAEEALAESEEKYRQLFSTDPDAVALFDAQTRRFLDVNAAALRLYGYTREEFLALEFADITADPEQCEANIQQVLAGSHGLVPVGHHKKKDGTVFPVEVSASSFILSGRRVLCGLVRDITERERAEARSGEQMARLRSLAMELSLAEERERRRLAGALHDDLAQLLVLAQIKLLMLPRSGTSAEDEKGLAEIEQLIARAVTSSRSLTNQLGHPALYDLGFAAGAEWLAEDIERLYGLRVSLVDDGRIRPIAERIRVVLFRCLRELLVNTAKHARVDEVTVRLERSGRAVRITVTDEGVGFCPDELEASRYGSGFGLFSIRERITYLGGSVTIRSARGQGTSVTLDVPAEPEASDP